MTTGPVAAGLQQHIEASFIAACRLDVATRKAGNVSVASAGHGMAADLFVRSAQAAVGPLCAPGRSVGERIEASVAASLQVAQCNTNLGILLLCAPLAAAAASEGALAQGRDSLRKALSQQLQGLDVADARAAYRAIAQAHPGGLGQAHEQDVAEAPSVGLREAMALAAHRDLIAQQYSDARVYPDVFDIGAPAFDAGLRTAPGDAGQAAMLLAFLCLLASRPDSHIVRKQGEVAAHTVMEEARPWLRACQQGHDLFTDPAYAAWDESLKTRGLNPGTSADLCVASAMLVRLTSNQGFA